MQGGNRKKETARWWEDRSHDIIKPHTIRMGSPQNGERCITEILLWAPHHASQQGKSPRVFGFEGQWGLIAGENQRFYFWRAHKRSGTCQNPGQEQWLQRGLGQTYLLVLEGLLGRQGVAMPLWDHKSWWQIYQMNNCAQVKHSPGGNIKWTIVFKSDIPQNGH